MDRPAGEPAQQHTLWTDAGEQQARTWADECDTMCADHIRAEKNMQKRSRVAQFLTLALSAVLAAASNFADYEKKWVEIVLRSGAVLITLVASWKSIADYSGRIAKAARRAAQADALSSQIEMHLALRREQRESMPLALMRWAEEKKLLMSSADAARASPHELAPAETRWARRAAEYRLDQGRVPPLPGAVVDAAG
jgi:hypothetical protein